MRRKPQRGACTAVQRETRKGREIEFATRYKFIVVHASHPVMRAFFIVSCGCRGVRLEECTSRCTRRATRNTTAVLTRKLLVAFFRLFPPSPLEFELRDVDYIFPGEFLRPTRSLECNVCMYMIRLNGDIPLVLVFLREIYY